MKKWMMGAVLAISAISVAHARPPSDIPTEQPSAEQPAQPEPGPGAVLGFDEGAQSAEEARREDEAEKRAEAMWRDDDDRRRSGVELKTEDSYEIEGSVVDVDVDDNSITLSREGAPPAELKVAADARVEVDGDRASITELRPGDEVRARFNLVGDDAFAIKVEGKRKN